jgi:hypothetical protein
VGCGLASGEAFIGTYHELNASGACQALPIETRGNGLENTAPFGSRWLTRLVRGNVRKDEQVNFDEGLQEGVPTEVILPAGRRQLCLYRPFH